MRYLGKNKMKPKLSILTPTIRGRERQLSFLMDSIEAKNNGEVEHLVLYDNRTRSIGAKRQALVDVARGEYIAFVDDDDDVSDDYVSELLKAIEAGADVITFHQRAIYNGLESEVHFGVKNQDGPFVHDGITLRAPWHVCAWKREVVAGCLFSESNYGEDLAWCKQARRRIRTGYHIPKILHTYRHDAATTAAPES
jgi:glycosyltransferase involved in cell wall biosynthesis